VALWPTYKTWVSVTVLGGATNAASVCINFATGQLPGAYRAPDPGSSRCCISLHCARYVSKISTTHVKITRSMLTFGLINVDLKCCHH
jgi:hypothetical protein